MFITLYVWALKVAVASRTIFTNTSAVDFENACTLQVTIIQKINSLSYYFSNQNINDNTVNFHHTSAELSQFSKNLIFALLWQHINHRDPEKALTRLKFLSPLKRPKQFKHPCFKMQNGYRYDNLNNKKHHCRQYFVFLVGQFRLDTVEFL